MNLIYDAKVPPKVFIDTTVLCGALRVDGTNRKILKAARYPNFFQPIVSRVCLFEFMRHALEGLGDGMNKVIYTPAEVEEFLRLFLYPILEYYMGLPVNSLVGRYSIETIIRENRPIGEVLVELSNCNADQAKKIVSSQEMTQPLSAFDQDDFHVWVTAIQEKCQYILTTNHKRFPEQIGDIKRIHPSDFYEQLSNP
ncbi:PIN domain-containing protein [Sporolactobacillus kofuensis]|uniref:PIN domain-containing protein n=1 Tax=Sporolactobacillus kofuensis TaxID=269672 RepID=A0ABW1WCF5_9BACL|nr:PIN domain-containing protein [Sporolactobacillus kofuensis]MCO7175414.1 PIN domain-containing protein [Sporolactobacillus kofuensis]